MILHKHLRLAFVYFLLVALMGTLLRFGHLFPIPFQYRFMVHAHSHIALLGWVYTALTTLLCYCMLPSEVWIKYQRLFLVTQVTLIGMLFTFPFQGYAFYRLFSQLYFYLSPMFLHGFLSNMYHSIIKIVGLIVFLRLH